MTILRGSTVRAQLCITVSVVLFVGPVALAGDSPRTLIEKGNAAYAAGRYEEALDAFKQIPDDQLTDRNRAEILHDRAAAHFKLGQLEEARELWVRAASLKDAQFEAQARYNLGDCDHAEALQAAQKGDAKTAIDRLTKAIDKYRDAIKLDPTLANARANLELAAQLKKQIEEQATSQPNSQPSSDQQKQDQKDQQSQPSSDQSQDQNSQSQPNSQPSSQPQSQPNEDQQDQQNQPQSQPESQPSEDEQPQSQPSQSQPTSQPQAAESQPATSQPDQQKNLMMSPQEAERLLQMIRDAEKQRREMLRRREAAKYKPVDRDW